jgi:hypothetical protein
MVKFMHLSRRRSKQPRFNILTFAEKRFHRQFYR